MATLRKILDFCDIPVRRRKFLWLLKIALVNLFFFLTMLSFYCRPVVTTNDLKLLLNSTCQNFSNQSMSTILDRSARAHTILADIRAILQDVPLGKYKLQVGLQLRESMFVNGVLFNSEVWQG